MSDARTYLMQAEAFCAEGDTFRALELLRKAKLLATHDSALRLTILQRLADIGSSHDNPADIQAWASQLAHGRAEELRQQQIAAEAAERVRQTTAPPEAVEVGRAPVRQVRVWTIAGACTLMMALLLATLVAWPQKNMSSAKPDPKLESEMARRAKQSEVTLAASERIARVIHPIGRITDEYLSGLETLQLICDDQHIDSDVFHWAMQVMASVKRNRELRDRLLALPVDNTTLNEKLWQTLGVGAATGSKIGARAVTKGKGEGGDAKFGSDAGQDIIDGGQEIFGIWARDDRSAEKGALSTELERNDATLVERLRQWPELLVTLQHRYAWRFTDR